MSGKDSIAKETRDEAARWYAKLNNTTVTTQCLREFREWREIGDNRQAYADIDAFWKRVAQLRNDEEIKAAGEEALNRKKPGGPALKSAIIALLVVSSGAALVYGYRAYVGTTYATEIGEQRLVRLEDGSRVRLDTDSQVRVRLTRGERRLDLMRGQAFFEVAHEPGRPFVVRAGDTSVRALGTRFEVSRANEDVQVTLVDGKVLVSAKFANGPGVWTLAPGGQVTVSENSASPPIRVDTAAATSWTTGRLVFQSQPLQSAIDEVNRYSKTKIALDDERLRLTPVSGSFESGDTEAFVSAIKDLYNLKVASRSEREIRLEPAA